MAKACGKCSRQRGIFKHACVVVCDPDVANLTGGACAGCWYGRMGSWCTLRQDAPPPRGEGEVLPPAAPAAAAATTPQRRAPPDPGNRPVPSSTAAAVPTAWGLRQAAPVPLHPSYIAALAAGTPSPGPPPPPPAPTPSPTPTPAAVPPKPPAPLSAAIVPPNPPSSVPSQDPSPPRDRVREWEERYSRMTTEELVEVHAKLIRWQEDLSARLVAMNRLALRRLLKHEGPSREARTKEARNGSNFKTGGD